MLLATILLGYAIGGMYANLINQVQQLGIRN
jgi:hypothetical protein